jgi:hypothetical protein
MKSFLIVTTCFLLILLAACSTSQKAPIQVVETYLAALAEKDENTLINLTCKEWEDQALLEYDSFSNVTTELKDLACELDGQTKNSQSETVYSVTCWGEISASYNGELRTFDLSDRVYQVIDRGGSLLVCGY